MVSSIARRSHSGIHFKVTQQNRALHSSDRVTSSTSNQPLPRFRKQSGWIEFFVRSSAIFQGKLENLPHISYDLICRRAPGEPTSIENRSNSVPLSQLFPARRENARLLPLWTQNDRVMHTRKKKKIKDQKRGQRRGQIYLSVARRFLRIERMRGSDYFIRGLNRIRVGTY